MYHQIPVCPPLPSSTWQVSEETPDVNVYFERAPFIHDIHNVRRGCIHFLIGVDSLLKECQLPTDCKTITKLSKYLPTFGEQLLCLTQVLHAACQVLGTCWHVLGNHLSSSVMSGMWKGNIKQLTLACQGLDSCRKMFNKHLTVKQVSSTWKASARHLTGSTEWVSGTWWNWLCKIPVSL